MALPRRKKKLLISTFVTNIDYFCYGLYECHGAFDLDGHTVERFSYRTIRDISL